MLALRSERAKLDTVFNDFSSFPFFIYLLVRFCFSFPTFLFLILLIREKYEKGENIDSKTSKYRNSFNHLYFLSSATRQIQSHSNYEFFRFIYLNWAKKDRIVKTIRKLSFQAIVYSEVLIVSHSKNLRILMKHEQIHIQNLVKESRTYHM